MKKTGLAVFTAILLMSCGGANDGKVNTDTTTFPSETKNSSDTMGLGAPPADTNTNSRMPSNNGAPPSNPASRNTTPGNNVDSNNSRQ